MLPMSGDKASFMLPASKTDIQALGTVRSWGCTCGGLCIYSMSTPLTYRSGRILQGYSSRLFVGPQLHATLPHRRWFQAFQGRRHRDNHGTCFTTRRAYRVSIQRGYAIWRTQPSHGRRSVPRRTGRRLAAHTEYGQMEIRPCYPLLRPQGSQRNNSRHGEGHCTVSSLSTATTQCPTELDIAARTILDHDLHLSRTYKHASVYYLNRLSWVLHKSHDTGMACIRTICGLHVSGGSYMQYKYQPNSFPHVLCSRCCKAERQASQALDSESSNSSDGGPTG